MMWIRVLFICFIWYNSPFLFLNLSNNLVDNFLISIVFFFLITFKLIYVYVLDNLNIIDISNQLWIFSFNEFFYKNLFGILSNSNLLLCVTTDDSFTFVTFYKMFNQQQFLLFILIAIFLLKIKNDTTSLQNLEFVTIIFYFYILIKYFILLNFFSIKNILLQISLNFYQNWITLFSFFVRYINFFNKSIILWKPLFKRWSYIGFYYKTKMFWLFKNRQK